MKRAIVLTLVLMMILSGCQASSSEDKVETKPTDELVVYIPPYADYWINPIIWAFKRQYGVEVTTVNFSNENYKEYGEKVTAELLSGEGPDIIFPNYMFANTHKLMENDIFMNLSPYFEQDKEFYEEDYLIKAFDAGKLGDKQYIVPITFSAPAYISSIEKTNEIGFAWDNAQTVSSFINQISDLLPAAQKNSGFKQMMRSQNWIYYFMDLSGIEFIDYEEKTVCSDEETIKEFFESYKRYFPVDYDESGVIYSDHMGYKHILEDEFYFENFGFMDSLMGTASVLKTNGGYEFVPLRGMDGKIHAELETTVAVRANSKNKLNAYNFIKVLLSEEIQSGRLVGMPVNTKALKTIADKERLSYNSRLNLSGYTPTLLEAEEVDFIFDTLCSADDFRASDSNITHMIFDTMLPYFQDQQDYDICFAELKSKLSLYMNE